MRVTPYLMFNGNCEAALRYYETHLGANITALMRYADAPPDDGARGDCPVSDPDKIMHAAFTVGESSLMASDAPGEAAGSPPGVWMSLTADDEIHAVRCFDALGDGGTIIMPLAPTFFAHQFGMVTDAFGVAWMVIVPQVCGEG